MAGIARLACLVCALAAAAVTATGMAAAARGAAGAAAPMRGGRGGSPLAPAVAGRAPELPLRAMLLLVAERRVYEPVTVLEALKAGPELRAQLAVALGRVPGRGGRSVLEGLLIDDQPEVRRAAAFSLGLRGEDEARPALLKAVVDPDRETGSLAVEALGRLSTPLAAVAEQLGQVPEQERWQRLLPYLFRFKEAALVPVAEHGLTLPDPELHRQAAYALARDPLPAAAPLLRRLAGDPDPLVRAWAARGLGRLGGGAEDLAALAPLLADAAAGPVVEALRGGAALAAAGKAAAGAPAGGAGSGISGQPVAPGTSAAAAGPGAGTGGVTGGTTGSSAAAASSADAGHAADPGAWRTRLLALLGDPRPGVRITAVEAAAAWLPDPDLAAALAARAAAPGMTAGGAAPPAGQRGPAAGVAAKSAAGRQAAPAPAPGDAVAAAVERGAALVSLARGRDSRAAALAAAAASSPEPRLRARAAEAAALLGESELLQRLTADRSPLVREAVLTARLSLVPASAPGRGSSPGAASGAGGARGSTPGTSPPGTSTAAPGSSTPGAAARGSAPPGASGPGAAAPAAGAAAAGARAAAAALADPDEGVRATACGWLADHPVVPYATLAAALTAALRDESIESPLGAIKALAARGEAEPLERGAVVELLERLGRQPSYALRREAAAALVRLGRPAPPLGPAPGAKTAGAADDLAPYREIVERTRQPRTVEVRTNRGSFRLRLDCPQAPRTCLNFLGLAAQHFYDGLLFHRVVPDFVIQAGDPRGDGFGGPGYTLGDEINRRRYARGTAGMALAGPDTGGSQFFITLSPQPHLDGGYTAFGEVTAGAEVLDAIQAGDRIDTIVEVR
jgi:cyclophilin family peptidyl-prolyl cis-trans isomerase